jgi:asparagine synthetase B (glutamine-hydrolysing)
LTGFSALFANLDCDERPLIEDVQRMSGVDVEYVFERDESSSRLRLEPGGFMEAPSMWSAGEREALLGAATRKGVRVLLTGEVADNYIGGARLVFDPLLRHGAWSRLYHDVAAYSSGLH